MTNKKIWSVSTRLSEHLINVAEFAKWRDSRLSDLLENHTLSLQISDFSLVFLAEMEGVITFPLIKRYVELE